MKHYGFAPVNALADCPFTSWSPSKYEEALVSICVAILSAIGVERLLRREVSARAQNDHARGYGLF